MRGITDVAKGARDRIKPARAFIGFMTSGATPPVVQTAALGKKRSTACSSVGRATVRRFKSCRADNAPDARWAYLALTCRLSRAEDHAWMKVRVRRWAAWQLFPRRRPPGRSRSYARVGLTVTTRGTATVESYKPKASSTPVNPANIYMTRPDGTANHAGVPDGHEHPSRTTTTHTGQKAT